VYERWRASTTKEALADNNKQLKTPFNLLSVGLTKAMPQVLFSKCPNAYRGLFLVDLERGIPVLCEPISSQFCSSLEERFHRRKTYGDILWRSKEENICQWIAFLCRWSLARISQPSLHKIRYVQKSVFVSRHPGVECCIVPITYNCTDAY
jgi:hypothetical protein